MEGHHAMRDRRLRPLIAWGNLIFLTWFAMATNAALLYARPTGAWADGYPKICTLGRNRECL